MVGAGPLMGEHNCFWKQSAFSSDYDDVLQRHTQNRRIIFAKFYIKNSQIITLNELISPPQLF